MRNNKDEKPQLRKSDLDVLATLASAASQYEEYVRVASVADLALGSSEEAWQHDPSAPLSLELCDPR